MKISGSQMLVNPVRTNETVSGAVNTPNFSQNLGIETKFAEMIEQNAYKYQELRDEEQFQYARSFILESIQAGQDFQLGLKTDDSYFKDKDKYAEYLQGNKDRKETFERLAKERGIKPEIVEAALQRSDRAFKETEAIHGKYVADYSEQKNKERNILLYDENSKLMSKAVLNGDTGLGKELYDDSINSLMYGLKNGYITADQMVARANAERENFLMSEIYSYVNDPDGELKLQELANKKFEDFYTEHEYLVGKYGDYKSDLTYEDFARWQGHISGALSKINTRNNAKKESNLYEVQQAEADRINNPVKYILKQYPINTEVNLSADEILNATTNIKYGTEYTSLDEHIMAGHDILSIDKSTSRAELYKNAFGKDLMELRIEENNYWTAGLPKYQAYAIADGQYMELAGTVLGGRGIELYKNSQNFKDTMDWLNSEDNKKVQAMIPNIDVSPVQFADGIEEVYGYSRSRYQGPTTELGMIVSKTEPAQEVTALFNPTLALKSLEESARLGDPSAKRQYEDIKGIYTRMLKTMIGYENGGILSEELADELDIKQFNVPISSLDDKQREKIFTYYAQNPTELFGSKNKMVQEVKRQFNVVLNEWFQDYQTVNLGTAGTLLIDKNMNGRDVQDAMSEFLERGEDFYLQDGIHKVSRREITLRNRIGSNVIVPFYKGLPLYNQAGKQIIYKLDQPKEVKQ